MAECVAINVPGSRSSERLLQRIDRVQTAPRIWPQLLFTLCLERLGKLGTLIRCKILEKRRPSRRARG